MPGRPPRQSDKLNTQPMHFVHDGCIGITTSVHARALNAILSLYRRPVPAPGACNALLGQGAMAPIGH